jgi:hypothetical protein
MSDTDALPQFLAIGALVVSGSAPGLVVLLYLARLHVIDGEFVDI